jgi:magnesium transporter
VAKLETVRDHFVESVPRARADETAARVLARLQGERPQCVELVCVTQGDDRLVGVVPLGRLFTAPSAATVTDLMISPAPSAHPDDDQERAASLALHHGLDALAVTDSGGRLRGVMPAQALMHVLRREHIEDLHLLAGIQRETARARHAIEDPPLRRARHRLPWLLFGLAGGAAATATMAGFAATLEKNLVVAFFVPALVYLADAIGTQSEAIAVRGLSLTRAGIAHLIAGELRTGMLLGAGLGLAAWLPIFLAFGDARLAAAVSASIFVAGGIASAIGLSLPWLIARHGWDPAYGSGPAATVIQDILTILVYFAVLRAFGV